MPGQRHELHHRICNLRYGTPGYSMSAYIGFCKLLFFFTQLFVYGLCVIIWRIFLYDVIDLPDS